MKRHIRRRWKVLEPLVAKTLCGHHADEVKITTYDTYKVYTEDELCKTCLKAMRAIERREEG